MTVAKHLEVFHDYVDKLKVRDEDVGMRLFVQSLVGEPMKSFQSLAVASIDSWVMLRDWFNATWKESRHGPQALPPDLHKIPVDYMDFLPRYNGENGAIPDERLDAFHDYMDKLNVQFEDVQMRLFVQSLEGEPKKHFRDLAVGSITSWHILESWFHETWGG